MISSIIWNIRGIRKAPAVRRLRKLICMHRLTLICIFSPFEEVLVLVPLLLYAFSVF